MDHPGGCFNDRSSPSLRLEENSATIENSAGEDIVPEASFPESQRINLTDFNILKPIGKGAFSKVYLVHKKDEPVSKLYAMKVTNKKRVLEQQRIHRLFSERNILKRFDHPFIVRLFYAFQTDSELFFVMSYLSGGDLNSYLHAVPGRRVSERLAQFYGAEVCLALTFPPPEQCHLQGPEASQPAS